MSYNNLKWARAGMLLSLTASLMACNAAKKGSGSQGSLSDDPPVINAAPKLNCQLRNQTKNSAITTITSYSHADFFNSSVLIEQNDLLTLDCSNTKGDVPLSQMTFQLTRNGVTTTLSGSQIMGTPFSLTAGSPGTYPMTVKVSDSRGLNSTTNFNVPVSCDPNDNDVDVSGVSISVANGGLPNFFNYSISGAPTITTVRPHDFQYAWDFNGDNIHDEYSVFNPAWWNISPTASNVYSIFYGNRTVKLTVRETKCNYVKAVTPLVYNFTNTLHINNGTTADGVPWAPPDILQGDVSRPALTSDPATNGTVLVTKVPGTPANEPVRIKCDYRRWKAGDKGSFSIYGLNNYDNAGNFSDSNSPGNNNFKHGITFKIQNINDDGSMAPPSPTTGASLTSANYYTADAGDATTYNAFAQNGGCTVDLRMKRAEGAVPCNDGSGNITAPDVQLKGTYSCPSLRTGSGKEVKIDNGFFTCNVAIYDQCVGGGGGGGGIDPIPQ